MEDLSLHLMDIIQNSIVANATYVEVGIIVDPDSRKLKIYVLDNGRGMCEEIVKKVTNPFYTTRTTRKAGLGVPLFKDAAEMTGGSFDICSEEGKGTKVTAIFNIDNIDRKPLGNVSDTIAMSIMSNPNMEFHLILKNGKSKYVFKTEDVREQIGNIPIDDIEIINFLREMLKEQINIIMGGILHEITG